MRQSLVFISYSPADEKEKDLLLTHLGGLQREGLIRAWSDDQIKAGDNWELAIQEAIAQAEVAILLVTANFLNADFILEKELPALLARHAQGELRILPIIVRACAWQSVKWLNELDVRPRGGRPVWSDGGQHVDEYLTAIAEELNHIIIDQSSPPISSTPDNPLTSASLKNGSQSSASPKPNPFGDKGRITDPSHFFDREELLRQIFEELNKGSNLSLVGDTQIGKSSLLAMICALGPERLQRPVEKIAYLNLEWVDDEDDFYEALCESLEIESCRGYKLTRVLRDKKFLLCLDEIEKMTWDGFTVRMRSHLRGLADGRDAPLMLVIASRSPLAHLFPDSPEMNSPLAGICRQLDVGPFSPEVARSFLVHRLKGTGVAFTSQQIDELIAESQSHPARLQQAAAGLYRELAQQLTVTP